MAEEKEEDHGDLRDDESAGFRTIGHDRVDERFISVLKSTILGVYITIKIRTADLDLLDPFRARVNLHCLYVIELMLHCIRLLGGIPDPNAGVTDAQRFTLRRFLQAVTHTLKELTTVLAGPSEDVKPKSSPSKKVPVMHISQRFHRRVALQFSQVPKSFDRDQEKKNRAMRAYEVLDSQMLTRANPAKKKKATQRLGVLAVHLERMRKMCSNVVSEFYERGLGAELLVEQKADNFFKDHGDEVLDLHHIVQEFQTIAKYVTAYEAWTKKFDSRQNSRNMRDLIGEGYVDYLRGFLELTEWAPYNPVTMGFIRFNGWSVDVEFMPSQDA